MKYLKYFESDEYLGITSEDLQFFFTDLSDEGWDVNFKFSRMLHQLASTNKILLGLIPHIEVVISHAKFDTEKKLKDLINSEEYKEIIDIINNRLNDVGFYVYKQYIENKKIFIILQRKI